MIDITPFANKTNLYIGAISALLAHVLGKDWFLFVCFLGLNAGDYLTRWLTARLTGTENSQKGWLGVLKKIGYWVMIFMSFGLSVMFIDLGEKFGVDLSITEGLGWFVLASLAINEARSILENLYEGGFPVPRVLVKGLEVANRFVEDVTETMDEEKN